MKTKKKLHIFMIMVIIVTMTIGTSCTSETTQSNGSGSAEETEESIDLETNGEVPDNDMDPDYEYVFDDSKVIEFFIEIDSDDWDTMQEDLAANVSTGRGDKQVRNDNNIKPTDNNIKPTDNNAKPTDNNAKPTDNNAKVNDNIAVVDDGESYEPIWVESTITVDEVSFDHVGIRYKGNSSLTSAVSSGNSKLSLKLDFDEFEDEYPETEDQRFYGFKQLNLNNNFSDTSLMHEKVAADLFNEFGVPAADTTFAVVYLDHGNGSEYYGVYALVEEMDDTGIENLFSDDSGNLYKPDGDAATFSNGSFDEGQMELKTNEEEADYSDVEALYEIMNSDLRTRDFETWKTELESIFNVDGFLKYLAANNIIQNWDTYGTMTHNYYLYNDPESGVLNWIPWDNNEAFSEGKGNRGAMSLSTDEVSDDWPLISYIMDDEDYVGIYEDYLQLFIDEVYTEEKMNETFEEYYQLIKEYAYAEVEGFSFISSDSQFDQSVEVLKSHVVSRSNAVESHLQ